MDERKYLAEALVLASFPYKEGDRIVTLFSRERGRQSALAKGACKPKNSLRALCQPPRYCRLALAKSRGSLDIITQGEMLEPFLAIHNDLLNIAYGNYIAELIIAGMPEKKPQPELFPLALAAFTLLELGEDPQLALIFFQLRYLGLLGLSPRLDNCSICSRRLDGGQFLLSPQKGGLICLSCGGFKEDALSAGAIKTMLLLMNIELRKISNIKISPEAYKEMRRALDNYFDYHLEYNPRARRFLDQVLEEEENNYT